MTVKKARTSRKAAAKTKTPKASSPRKTARSKAKPKPSAAADNKLLNVILARLDEEKASNTIQIDLKDKSTIADYMVITSGRSNRHVNAITDHLVETLHKNGHSRLRVEGLPHCDWVLIDAGDVIVHVFRPEVRAFYNLEKMWARSRPET